MIKLVFLINLNFKYGYAYKDMLMKGKRASSINTYWRGGWRVMLNKVYLSSLD